jgi:hypothetical protein
MSAAKRIEGDMFDAYVAYLRQSATYVEKVYQLEKAGGFVGAGTPESREFTADRLAAGASMLRDMIYTAWVESAKACAGSLCGQVSAGKDAAYGRVGRLQAAAERGCGAAAG